MIYYYGFCNNKGYGDNEMKEKTKIKRESSCLPKGFYKTAFSLAIPIALQNLLTSSGSLVDTIMVIGLGNTKLSAIGLAGRLMFLFNVACFGFCSGGATMFSQYWGAGDRKNVRRTFCTALTAIMIFGLIFALAMFCAPSFLMRIFTDDPVKAALGTECVRIYAFGIIFIAFSQIGCAALRATEKVSVPLIASAISVLVNTCLNYIMINGKLGFPRMELRGAALATVISAAVQAIIVLLFIIFSDNAIKSKIEDFRSLSKEFFLKYFRIASPVILNEVMWAVGTNIYVIILASMGDDNYAGYTIYESVQQLLFVFFVGICHSSAIIVGKYVGDGKHREAFAAAKRFLVMVPLMGLLMGVIITFTRGPLLSIMPVETESARAVASSLLLIYGYWLVVRMIPYTAICGIFRAGGDTKTGCYFEILAIYVLGIPAAYICRSLGASFVLTVFAIFFAEDVVKGSLCLYRFFSRKWIKQITDVPPEEVFPE